MWSRLCHHPSRPHLPVPIGLTKSSHDGLKGTQIQNGSNISQLMSATEPSKIVPGRQCGSCTLCCKVLGISEFGKPAGVWCSHCAPAKGCNIYEMRPAECRSFLYSWLTTPQLGPEWKPDRSKIVLTQPHEGNGTITIRCDPGFPDAWRRAPYYQEIMRWCEAAHSQNRMVVVCVGKKFTLITKEGEFPLGEVEKDDKIVRHFSGRGLVAARVVKASRIDPDQP